MLLTFGQFAFRVMYLVKYQPNKLITILHRQIVVLILCKTNAQNANLVTAAWSAAGPRQAHGNG